MKNQNNDDIVIDISKIPDAPRYFFPVKYVFPGKYDTCAAFEKVDFETGFHIQEFYELCIISKGQGYHIIEDTVVKAIRGDVFIVPPGRKHAFVGGKGFNVYYIHLSPMFLEHNTPRLKTLPAFFALFEIEPLMRVNGAKYRHLYLEENVLEETLGVLDIVSQRWQGNQVNQVIQEAYIVIALTILCREYAKLQTIVGKNANEDKLFMDSVSYVLENYSEKITIEVLASKANMSRTTYINKFSEVFGIPPRQFIMQQRVKAAKELLSRTDKPIVRIADECGFYDAAHLNKCFTAAEHVSPTEYRKSALQN